MKPAPFHYVRPERLDEALETLAEHGDEAKILAGGQSLIPVMNFRLAQPAVLVDVNRLAELDFVTVGDDGGLRLGALVRQSRLEGEAAVARRAPLLAEAVPFIAHPQIRHRGTVGGSLAHADPAAELPAVAVALDARFRLVARGGERWVAARDFFGGLFATALEPGEMLAEVAVPPRPERTGWAFQEVSRRPGDYAMVGVAARVSVDGGGRCTDVRLVYMSVGDVPVEVRFAEASGEEPSEELLASLAARAEAQVDPAGDIHAGAEYRRHVAGVLARRTLRRAAARAGNGGEVS